MAYAHQKVWQLLLYLFLTSVAATPDNTTCNTTKVNQRHDNQHGHASGIKIFKVDFKPIEVPFIICVWILIASVAKIIFYQNKWLSSHIPESCVLIILGIPLGKIVEAIEDTSGDNASELRLTSKLFFNFLLPPIILDAGYFVTTDVFFKNVGTILLYAIIGTIFNSIAVGFSMYGVSGVCGISISPLQCLVFGSLISAVDPVAVLTVFEEVQVNEILYILVFGESVLNDAASVVLYRTFDTMAPDNINLGQIALAVTSFFVVSCGGMLIGAVFALVASFITKYTNHVLVIEPLFVFIMAYLAYLTAEIFHFSGIMSILFCGLIMRPYVESNVSHKSHRTIKSFLKLLSSTCEAIIFMYLGVSMVQFNKSFNVTFFLFTLLFISVFRAIGIVGLTSCANRFGRLSKVNKVEQFIMTYGGLRGAVAFCLATCVYPDDCSGVEIPLTPELEKVCQVKSITVTTTIAIVLFTVFIQGCSMKKLVEKLGVKRSDKRERSMVETLNERCLSYTVAGIEEILGQHSYGFWMNLFDLFNRKYLRRWLEREPDLALDEELVYTQKKIAFKTALSYATETQQNGGEIHDGQPLHFAVNFPELEDSEAAANKRPFTAQFSEEDNGLIGTDILNNSTSSKLNESNCRLNVLDSQVISSLFPGANSNLESRFHNLARRYTLAALEDRDSHSQVRNLTRERSLRIEDARRKNRDDGTLLSRRTKSCASHDDESEASPSSTMQQGIVSGERPCDNEQLHRIDIADDGHRNENDCLIQTSADNHIHT